MVAPAVFTSSWPGNMQGDVPSVVYLEAMRSLKDLYMPKCRRETAYNENPSFESSAREHPCELLASCCYLLLFYGCG